MRMWVRSMNFSDPVPKRDFRQVEGTDFFLRALDSGHRIWYEPSISVFHPSGVAGAEPLLDTASR